MKLNTIYLRRAFTIQVLLGVLCTHSYSQTQSRIRDWGIEIGVMQPGKWNALTDVPGVQVGHSTLQEGDHIRTGVTAILPHEGNLFQEKVQAAMYIGNGFGKLMGYSQVEELGTLETPIALTNTLSVPRVADALITYTLAQSENVSVRSVNPVVGETNDGRLNDIRGRHIREAHVLEAIQQAKSGPIAEGSVGAGSGTICFGFKGGIGTASRQLPPRLGGYHVGVLVQSNFGGVLRIEGAPVGEILGRYYLKESLNPADTADGSIMVVVATDAPVDVRNLKRMAKRAMLGIAQAGGIASNGSGDYVIAFTTQNRVSYQADSPLLASSYLRNDRMSPLFMATIEATEEAILNSLFASAQFNAGGIQGLPLVRVKQILQEMGRIK